MKLIENDTSVMKTYQPVGKTIHHPKNDTSIYYIRFGTRDFAGRSDGGTGLDVTGRRVGCAVGLR